MDQWLFFSHLCLLWSLFSGCSALCCRPRASRQWSPACSPPALKLLGLSSAPARSPLTLRGVLCCSWLVPLFPRPGPPPSHPGLLSRWSALPRGCSLLSSCVPRGSVNADPAWRYPPHKGRRGVGSAEGRDPGIRGHGPSSAPGLTSGPWRAAPPGGPALAAWSHPGLEARLLWPLTSAETSGARACSPRGPRRGEPA